MSRERALAYVMLIVKAHNNAFSYINLDELSDGSAVVYFDASVRSDTVQGWFRKAGLQTDYCGMTRVGLDICYELHFWEKAVRAS